MIKMSLAAAILLGTTEAVTLSNQGIFDKVFKEEAEEAAIVKEKQEAIDYKKQQLAQAESEHEKAVKIEEQEDKQKEIAEEKAFEEREMINRQNEADKRKAQMMAEIDRENVLMRSSVRLAQVSQHGEGHGELIDGEGIEFVNQQHAQEKPANAISDMIGSGPPTVGMSQI